MMSPMFRLFRFNSFQSNVPFLHPLKTENLLGFLMFSRGVKREHQREMGEESILF